jgi:zinc transport system substrate-binding protein
LAPTGPHDHQATADDAHLAASADLFLVNGLKLDDFVTSVVNNSGNRKIKIVEVSDKGIPKAKLIHLGDHNHAHAHAPGEEHDHGEWDPHTWLGTEQAILMVKKIAVTLKEADSAHAANYDQRAAAYIKKLDELQAFGEKLLAGKKNKKIIATHESLGYFCKSYGLELVASIMPKPGIEANQQELAKLLKICKGEQVGIIAIEPQYSKAAAENLQMELKNRGHHVEIVLIDPFETAERDKLNADHYFEVMRQNLQNLADKMK